MQRERGEEECGRPALEPLCESGGLLSREQDAGSPEEGLCFATLQRELVGPDLEQAAFRSQAGQRQRRRASRRERDARPVRRLTEHPFERGERRRRAENVHVVDEYEKAGLAGDRSEPRLESFGIVVLWLEVDPQNRTPVALGPLGQQCRLAESRRRDDRDDRAVRGTAEPVEESGPNDGLSGRRAVRQGSTTTAARAGQWLRDGHTSSLQARLRQARGQAGRAYVGTPTRRVSQAPVSAGGRDAPRAGASLRLLTRPRSSSP